MAGRIASFITIALIATTIGCIADQSNKEKEQAAVAAAEQWLALVDAGKYDASWKESAEYFRNAVEEKQWGKWMTALRQPIGALVSRKLKSATYKTTLPGAPDGEYVVIEFTTVFANKVEAVEKVTPLLDKDGLWRVAGYYVK